MSIRAEWGGWYYSGVKLDLIRAGNGFALDGRFSTKPSAPGAATISADEFESFLCVMASHPFGAPPQPGFHKRWTDDDPAGEIVFRPKGAAPVRAFFLDQRRQWVIAPWGTDGRTLADDLRPNKDDDIDALKSHPSIDAALRRLLVGVAGPNWMELYEDAGTVPHEMVPDTSLPVPPPSLAEATSLTIEDIVTSNDTDFEVHIELTRGTDEVFATLRFEVGSSWPAETFTAKVPPASFEQWLRTLEQIRAASSRKTLRDGPLDEKTRRHSIETAIVPASVIARVPGAWPAWFEWRSKTPTLRVHDEVVELPPPVAGRLRAVRADILRAVDARGWARTAYDRGPLNGWRH